jgi:hypothetical protein
MRDEVGGMVGGRCETNSHRVVLMKLGCMVETCIEQYTVCTTVLSIDIKKIPAIVVPEKN